MKQNYDFTKSKGGSNRNHRLPWEPWPASLDATKIQYFSEQQKF